MSARVCACVGLFAGVDWGGVVMVMGVSRRQVWRVVPALVRDGRLSRVRKGKRHLYYLTKKGRRLMEEEREALRREHVAFISRARSLPGVLPEVLEQMEAALRKGMI